jgi:CO/xanthine dehydrogenase FAD-binding subunit
MPYPFEAEVESPQDLLTAYRLLASDTLRPLAGGTDAFVQLAAGLAAGHRWVDISRLHALHGIRDEGSCISVGSLTTYAELRNSTLVARLLPQFVTAASQIGAVQIQNRGTLGGNIANASPAGDMLPLLLATDADITLGSLRGERSVPAMEFWTGYRRTVCAADELVVSVKIPVRDGRHVRFRKVGTRRAQAISKVVLALGWKLDHQSRWREVRLSLGSIAERPIRAFATEQVLEGCIPDEGVGDAAVDVLINEIHPIDDVRSTAAYRRLVAGRVLRRLVLGERPA